MSVILDGKQLRDRILEGLQEKLKTFSEKPTLVVILVGDDPASKIYVNNKNKTAEKIGINSIVINYPSNVTEDELLAKINELNNDDDITAILVQLPLPAHIDKFKIINAISPKKDVDGFTPENFGKLFAGEEPYVYPCTPRGILLLMKEYNINPKGKHAVIIGRSNIVGKPLSQMLLKQNATVTVCHSHTQNLSDITKTADIVISAVGQKIVNKSMLKPGAVIIDVGIFKDEYGKTRGDVDYTQAAEVASFITPVPGGVGPMTIAMLMSNTVELFEKRERV